MPRLIACHTCAILQRIPDPAPNTPMVPARLEWKSGEEFVYTDDKGLPVMVPAYDPVLEDFLSKHEHGADEMAIVGGQVIAVWQVDQKTWDSIDVVTKIKTALKDQTNKHYEDTDTYREGAAKCYNEHGNPDLASGCRDYLDDSKRIGPAEYHEDGRTITVPPKFRHYLCYVCPYQQSVIQVELRRRRGQYNEQKVMANRARHRKKVRR